MPSDLSIQPQALYVPVRPRMLRRLLIWLGLICLGFSAIALSLYLWKLFPQVQAGNWLASVLCGLATLGMLVAAAVSRSATTALAAIVIGIPCTLVGFHWGLLDLFWFLIAAPMVADLIAWLRRRNGGTYLRPWRS